MEPMKLWIDNEKDPALAPQFGLDPAGWIVARSVSEAVALIRSSSPDEIALSASRIQQSYRLLSQMLTSAIDCGVLDRNPSLG